MDMAGRKLTLAFSPCPNDTFMFDAMIHNRIDTEGLEFETLICDIEDLNQMASEGVNAVTKISMFAFMNCCSDYQLLDAGVALGKECGPLLLAASQLKVEELYAHSIAIPGINTTANLLLSMFFPKIKNKTPLIFSRIEDSIIAGKVKAGLVIHESRFTYASKGLFKIFDLGTLWEQKYKLPLPLGGIAVRRNLNHSLKLQLNRILKRSVEYALLNPGASSDFVRQNAVEMDEKVINQHIRLYVNDYSVDLGEEGRNSIHTLFGEAVRMGFAEKFCSEIFYNGDNL
jgi:1,4-dihydroxy-6-naphthoate synthase